MAAEIGSNAPTWRRARTPWTCLASLSRSTPQTQFRCKQWLWFIDFSASSRVHVRVPTGADHAEPASGARTMIENEPDLSPESDKLVGKPSAALPEPNKGEPELVVTATPEAAAREAAERIAAALIAAVERRGRADFCTTGGNTPIPIYRLLAQAPLCDSIPWPQVHFWWGDDRFVPRGDPESNVTALDDVLSLIHI